MMKKRQRLTILTLIAFFLGSVERTHAFVVSTVSHKSEFTSSRQLSNDSDDNCQGEDDSSRRNLLTSQLVSLSAGLGSSLLLVPSRPALAWSKSRTDGYAVQMSDREWRSVLSNTQYEILRKGGTERPGFSILETEKRTGIFKCAGCGSPLFDSVDKFNSGTGWPSFARGSSDVEIEPMNPMLAGISGAEIRCKTCGGHLGDVFQDGFLFVGTEAAKTGQRFCVDGAALVFYPSSDDDSFLRGDIPKKKEVPSWLEPPKISPQ